MLRDNVECVYNLIPPPPSSTNKKRQYPKSKYKADEDTFNTCAKTTRSRATFGHAPGTIALNTNEFLKKHSRRQLKPIVIHTPKVRIKPLIPHDKGAFVHKDKDFITENAVEVIHARALKKLPTHKPRYVDKANYGQVPLYLQKFNDILREKKNKVNMGVSKREGLGTQPNTRRLEEWERQELIEGLKKKWQQVNTTYQTTSLTLDTWAKKARKERFEDQLMDIERDIQTLSRRVVLVVDNGKSQSSGSYSSGRRRHLANRW